jgi:hypothetical protein
MATNKQFSMGKNGPNSPDFEKKKEKKKKVSKSPNFNDKFQ